MSEKKPKSRRLGGKTKKGPNKWLLRIFRGYDAAGKRIYHSEVFYGGSIQADDRLLELRNRQRAGMPLKFQTKIFADYFEEWIDKLDDGERREVTIKHYRDIANAYLLPAFGKFTLTDISDVAIQRLYKQLRKDGYSQSTLLMVHVVLSMIMKAAAAGKNPLIIRNPMTDVKAPKQPKPNPVSMTTDEVTRFLDAAAARPEGAMFELAYFLGARPCEYLGLKWEDLDAKKSEIKIQRSLKRRVGGAWYTTPPKTEASVRTIELTPYYLKLLQDQRRRILEMKLHAGSLWTDTGFIFVDGFGQPLKISSVRWMHGKIRDAAGLPATFKLKVSRHSCASAMLKAGKSLKLIQARLGHSSIRITADTYTVIEKELQRQASEAIEEMFKRSEK